VADEEVGADADELPEDEHHREVIREDDTGHREHEEREAGEVARLPGIFVHVTEREDVYEPPDRGDDEHHATAEFIECEPDIEGEVADFDPLEKDGLPAVASDQ